MKPLILDSVWLFLSSAFFVGAIGAFIVTRLAPPDERAAHRMISQPALTVVGMMFSVLLGFFIAQSMRNFQDMNTNATQEANALGNLFHIARGLDSVDRVRIRKLCREYADAVINDEWRLMAEGRDSQKALDIFHRLWEAVLSIQSSDQGDTYMAEEALENVQSLGEHRRIRTTNPGGGGLDVQLWVIISMGAAAIIVMTYMFAPESKKYHACLLVCLLGPITLNAYLLSEYMYPFTGFISVKPTMLIGLQQKVFIQADSPPRYEVESKPVENKDE